MRTTLLLVALLLITSVVAVSCGSGSSGDADSDSADQSPSSAAVEESLVPAATTSTTVVSGESFDGLPSYTVSAEGSVGGETVDVVGTSTQVDCAPQRNVILHHISWAGDGAEHFEHLSVWATNFEPYQVVIGLQLDEDLTELDAIIDRSPASFPKLYTALTDESSSQLTVSDGGMMVSLNNAVLSQIVSDYFSSDDQVIVSGEFGCDPVTADGGGGTGERCGQVATEDGPLETEILEGTVDCAQVLQILGSLVGTGGENVTGDFNTGWNVEGWTCRAETRESGAVVYLCTSPPGSEPAVIGTVAVEDF